MDKVEWKNVYQLGVDEIDLQHHKLISIMNNFYDTAVGDPKEYPLNVGKSLKKLTDYTYDHFTYEEALMEKYKYPDVEKHKAQHKIFINQLNSKIPRIAKGNQAEGQELYDFLLEWLLHHIAHIDSLWAEHVLAVNSARKK